MSNSAPEMTLSKFYRPEHKMKERPGKAAPCIDETAGLDLNQLAALSRLCSQVASDATTMARLHNSLNYGHSAFVPKCSETRIV